MPRRRVIGWAERRDQRLAGLGYANYRAYLESPAWAEVRSRYRRSRSLPQDCLLCGSTEATLLHHRTYERVGEEELGDLAPLCNGCHSMVHELEHRGSIDGLDAPSRC